MKLSTTFHQFLGVREAMIALGLMTGLLFCQAALAPDGTAAPVSCDKWASPTGSDANAGTRAAPYSTAQRLANSLLPGQTGCLKAGTYTQADKEVNISAGGNAKGRITLMTAPSEPSKARINARVVVGTTADYLTLRYLRMDGSYGPLCPSGGTCKLLPSPTISGDYVTLINNEITNRRPGYEATRAGICIHTRASSASVYGLLIEDNRIHNCGVLPITNHDHGIYLTKTRDAIIRNNKIYDNADRGIQFYPDADRTLVEGNIIDGNGEGVIFSGGSSTTSDNNEIRNNVISNSKIRWLVEEYWSGPVGKGNIVHDNCLWPTNTKSTYNQNDGVQPNSKGFASYANLKANPLYDSLREVGTQSACHSVYP